MKTLNTRLVMSALAIALLGTPAFAQTAQPTHLTLHRAHHPRIAARQPGLNAYARIPATQGSALDPASTGGGSLGYNENLRTDAW
jgi:hypothetical protein